VLALLTRFYFDRAVFSRGKTPLEGAYRSVEEKVSPPTLHLARTALRLDSVELVASKMATSPPAFSQFSSSSNTSMAMFSLAVLASEFSALKKLEVWAVPFMTSRL